VFLGIEPNEGCFPGFHRVLGVSKASNVILNSYFNFPTHYISVEPLKLIFALFASPELSGLLRLFERGFKVAESS
jgi:hypothetical protein